MEAGPSSPSTERTSEIAQMVEWAPSNKTVLSSNPSKDVSSFIEKFCLMNPGKDLNNHAETCLSDIF